METNPRTWFSPLIGHLHPAPLGHYEWKLLAATDCTLVLRQVKGPFLTHWCQLPIIQFGKKRWERQTLSVELLKFRVLWNQAAVDDFQESTFLKRPLSNALHDRREAQMAQKETLWLQMYLMTASWQGLLLSSTGNPSATYCPPSLQAHTHMHSWAGTPERMMTGSAEDRLVSRRHCRKMVTSLKVVECVKWDAAKPLTLQGLLSPYDSVRCLAELGGY